jgi:hypothetical protein
VPSELPQTQGVVPRTAIFLRSRIHVEQTESQQKQGNNKCLIADPPPRTTSFGQRCIWHATTGLDCEVALVPGALSCGTWASVRTFRAGKRVLTRPMADETSCVPPWETCCDICTKFHGATTTQPTPASPGFAEPKPQSPPATRCRAIRRRRPRTKTKAKAIRD